MRTGIVPIADQDQQLAKLILRDGKASAINFTSNLIRDCVLVPNPSATREHFIQSLKALTQVVQAGKGTEMYVTRLCCRIDIVNLNPSFLYIARFASLMKFKAFATLPEPMRSSMTASLVTSPTGYGFTRSLRLWRSHSSRGSPNSPTRASLRAKRFPYSSTAYASSPV